ncbi:hypothetical protein FIV31_06175 [Coxiella endosymbiont of Ornithodoros amblus]|uniref:hypothetical protein n=1 Tax=Coxiella endosymbiont of Ornithodoros amblus TaxID=1656166 RepID=UPI00244DB981|nr:hypothetical protein [Coxiella endosymbiont of Ornithodoros amblus]MBW5802926.1 hypothetical protein [Coxiella endosymbiont of Ornithodoros amblus]
METPVFLSSYFKKYQQLYCEKLAGLSPWKDFYSDRFFLDAVIEIVNEAIDVVGKIIMLRKKDMEKIQELSKSVIKILPR